MAYPTRDQLRTSLLLYIYQNGGGSRAVEAAAVYEPLADDFKLSASERRSPRRDVYKDNRPEPAWHSMVQYTRRDLLHRGMLSSEAPRGVWQLTHAGVRAAELGGKVPPARLRPNAR
jgi:hypothetical protein